MTPVGPPNERKACQESCVVRGLVRPVGQCIPHCLSHGGQGTEQVRHHKGQKWSQQGALQLWKYSLGKQVFQGCSDSFVSIPNAFSQLPKHGASLQKDTEAAVRVAKHLGIKLLLAMTSEEKLLNAHQISPASEPPLGAAGKAVAGLAAPLCALSRCNGLSDSTIPAPYIVDCRMALVLAACSSSQG